MNDEQPQHWTGRPMAEQCETYEFFEPKKVYREQAKNKPNLADELKGQFWCMGTFVHPSTRIRYAIGVFRSGANRPWNAYPVHFIFSNWADGWDEIELQTEENHT